MTFTKKIFVVLLLIAVLVCSLPIGVFAQAIPTSADGGRSVYFNDHKYQVFETYMTWQEAKEYCESLGGHLATITSAEEQSVLNNFDGNYWLGGTDSGSEGNWRWITGEAWIYTNWDEGEDNNLDEIEHYLTTWYDFTWNDLCYDSYEQGGFICEWDTLPTTQVDQILGVYEGSYTAPQGLTGLTLSIYRTYDLINNEILLQKYADVANSCGSSSSSEAERFTAATIKEILSLHSEDYIALFNFYPVVDKETGEAPNPDVEEGLYTMIITYDDASATYEFLGSQWIQHDTYAMADLKNITLSNHTLSGDVYGEYASWFWTEYGDVGDVSVSSDSQLSGYRIDFETDEISVGINASQQIKAVVKDSYGIPAPSATNIRWFSNDESIATVTGENWGGTNDALGTIVGVSEGTTHIYAELDNRRVAVCTVSVKKSIVIKGRYFDNNIDYHIANINSFEYDPILANMLAALSAAAYCETEIQNAYESLGFDDSLYKSFWNDYDISNPNRVGYNIAIKESSYNNDIICLIVVRGSQTTSDWIGDFNIDTTLFEGKHVGFTYPAYHIYDHIESVLGENITAYNVKYVITGHSRGAAVGNLLAVELMEQGVNSNNIYDYNYACPDVACKIIFPTYMNIFNLCNRADIVTMLPGSICSVFTTPGTSWGKYGQTHWFTLSRGRIDFKENHSSDLYLEFFDQQSKLSDWPYSSSDKISDTFLGIAGWISKIFCPVDVIVTDENGNQVVSVINGETTYYDSSFKDRILVFTDGDKKVIYINDETNFNVDLIATDEGTMTFAVERCNLATGEVTESKTFNNVTLEAGKKMHSSVSTASGVGEIELFVVEEKDGEMVPTYQINTDGTETLVLDASNNSESTSDTSGSTNKNTGTNSNSDTIFNKKMILIGGAAAAGILLLAIVVVIIKKKKH